MKTAPSFLVSSLCFNDFKCKERKIVSTIKRQDVLFTYAASHVWEYMAGRIFFAIEHFCIPRCRSPPLLKFDWKIHRISEELEEILLSKRYFRKKDPESRCIEWVEMSGSEYYRFVTAPESKGRYFIDMSDVVLECTKAEYKMYKAEDAHSNYVLGQEAGWITQSLESLCREGGLYGEELIADATEDVSATAIRNIQKTALRKALQMLSKEEYRMIMLKYHPLYELSEEKIGILVGLSQSGVSRKLTAIKNFLKNFVMEFEKNLQ